MKQVKIIIERSKDHFSAYAENVEGIYGGGDTPEEAKKSIVEAIELLKKHNKSKNVPAILKSKYELVFKFDTEILLKYYKGIFTKAGLERITGINQRQIQHYSSGLKKPRLTQAKKIESALHKLGKELLAIEL
jgi:predicted RNase H-like HicB family nuclease